MQKACITFLIIAIIVLSGIGLNLSKTQVQTEYLRIHVRANSNDSLDQAIKYKIKVQIVLYLTPKIAECDTKIKAINMLNSSLGDIKDIADKVLAQSGFNYQAKASLKEEQFPTRVYGNLELESGIYDALIIELGSGQGDNWWCVVYPPLCFTGEGTNYVYRSKILDIISDFFKRSES